MQAGDPASAREQYLITKDQQGAAEAARQITKTLTGDKEAYQPAVGPLVSWVYTLPEEQLAELILAPEGLPETRVPLVASEDVARGGFAARLKTVSGLLLTRLSQGPEGAL